MKKAIGTIAISLVVLGSIVVSTQAGGSGDGALSDTSTEGSNSSRVRLDEAMIRAAKPGGDLSFTLDGRSISIKVRSRSELEYGIVWQGTASDGVEASFSRLPDGTVIGQIGGDDGQMIVPSGVDDEHLIAGTTDIVDLELSQRQAISRHK